MSMDSSSSLTSSFLMIKSTSIPSFPILKNQIHFHSHKPFNIKNSMIIKASNSASSASNSTPNPFISTIKNTAASIIFTVAVFGQFNKPAKAFFFPPAPSRQQESISVAIRAFKEVLEPFKLKKSGSEATSEFGLNPKFNTEAIEGLKTLLQKKLKGNKKKECLDILQTLSSVQPEITDWKFLAARLLNELGNTQEAIEVLLPILLEKDDLPSVLTVFEISLLMDLSAVEEYVKKLDDMIRVSSEDIVHKEKQGKEERLIRMFLAQLEFLLNDVDEALRIYEELQRDDPSDSRPYFCKGIIYTLLDRKQEAREQFSKFRELSPEKVEMEWYLRAPTRRMRMFLSPQEIKN